QVKPSTLSKDSLHNHIHMIPDSESESESSAVPRAPGASTPDLVIIDSPPVTTLPFKSRRVFDCVLIPRKHVSVPIDPSRTLSQPPSEISSSEADPSADEDYSVGSDSGEERRRSRRRSGRGGIDNGERPLGAKDHGDLVEILEKTVTRQGRIYYTVV